jgi:hypothetical protein
MAQEQPSQNRPASPKHAPDPASSYGRENPKKEAGMGSLDSPIGQSIPADHHGDIEPTVNNAHPGDRQLNAHDDPGGTGGAGQPLNEINLSRPAPNQPDHSMHDEEPMGWDQAPTDIKNPRDQRHPRTGGQGGTPNAGQPESRG